MTIPADEFSVDDLAEEFACRWRAGERPTVEEYVTRFPQWADEIYELFPAVVLMEQHRPRREQPTPLSSWTASAARAPERLGEYQILREIGRGGMGVVYEAYQEALGRRVALKVLPAHLFNNEKLRARFRRESQAAARLHHTNIVPVFAVGEEEGLCYYVMQLIHGHALDAAPGKATATARPGNHDTGLQHSHGESEPIATPAAESLAREPYDHLRAAAIGMQVADALAYAHGQGVLHRDIKPSNLLLDEHEAVWVTDFGVAKLVEESQQTQSGELLGTLRYMPPERFHGVSDARGDVYSLGMTLYELLARRPAFPDTTPHQLIQRITHTDPPALRKLDPSIPADLEIIVAKAAARDPDHRYQTAAELADDLRRFLDDRPIHARRISAAEQVWRWCRRNRLVAGLAAAAVALLVITTVVSVVAYFSTAAANSATASANQGLTNALHAEQAEREHAERTSASVLRALNHIYDRFAPTRLLVTPALPADEAAGEDPVIPAQPTLSPETVQLLEELLDFYEQLAREGGDYPRLRAQAAEANQRIGEIRQRLGKFDLAAAAYQKAADLYERPAEGSLDDAARIRLARTYNEWGRTLQALQRMDASRQAHLQALATLRKAQPDAAARPEYRYELARTYYFQARRDILLRPPEPDRNGRRGPAGRGMDGRGPEASGPEGRGPFGRGPNGRGPEGRGRAGPGDDMGRRGPRGGWRGPDGPGDFGPGWPGGRPGGGAPGGPAGGPPQDGADNEASQRAIALLKGLVQEHGSVPEYRHLLACCYRDAPPDRSAGGPPVFGIHTEEALRLLRQLVGDFPKVPDFQHDLCDTLARSSLPMHLTSLDQLPAAKKRLEEAILLADGLAANYPNVPQYAASRAFVYERLGSTLHALRESEEGELALRKGIAVQSALVKQHSRVVAFEYALAALESSLARVLVDVGNWEEARGLLESSCNRLDTLLKKDDRLMPARQSLHRNYRDLAEVLTRLGYRAQAVNALKQSESYGPPPRREGP